MNETKWYGLKTHEKFVAILAGANTKNRFCNVQTRFCIVHLTLCTMHTASDTIYFAYDMTHAIECTFNHAYTIMQNAFYTLYAVESILRYALT